jgi:hypothetical protein
MCGRLANSGALEEGIAPVPDTPKVTLMGQALPGTVTVIPGLFTGQEQFRLLASQSDLST